MGWHREGGTCAFVCVCVDTINASIKATCIWGGGGKHGEQTRTGHGNCATAGNALSSSLPTSSSSSSAVMQPDSGGYSEGGRTPTSARCALLMVAKGEGCGGFLGGLPAGEGSGGRGLPPLCMGQEERGGINDAVPPPILFVALSDRTDACADTQAHRERA